MKDKKTIIIAVVILLLVLVGAVGASYAYFATVNKTTGNEKNLNIVTENLGDIKWEGTKVYTSGDLLPGECGIQTFTIEKNSATGKGIYEIDLKGILDESFGTDVEITLYKSTDTTTNNVTIKEGNSTISGDTTKQYYKEDSVVLNGTPEKVYGTKALQNKDQIILEQADFDNSTLSKTTYYLVYCYKNNGNQDAQQGKSFSGEISVKLILEKWKASNMIGKKATAAITMLSNYDTTNLAIDDYGNTRYIGADPSNYVSIDGDIWRIIGVMKDIDDGTGNMNERVKIIRSEAIGNYSWDVTSSSWRDSALMKLLNPGYENESVGGSLYWNNSSGTCYVSSNKTIDDCDFKNNGITQQLKNLIGNALWKVSSSTTYKNATDFFEDESIGNTWVGKIGLMSVSDYGYATSGSNKISREKCITTNLSQWYDGAIAIGTATFNNADCGTYDWLFKAYTWLMNESSTSSHEAIGISGGCPKTASSTTGGYYCPKSDDPNKITICPVNECSDMSRITKDTSISSRSKTNDALTYPSAYLLSTVKISSGTGSKSDPFTLSL